MSAGLHKFSATYACCVGYRQAWQHQDGEFDLATLRDKGIAATRQLAKRQMTWLRGMDDVEELDCLESGLVEKLEQRIQEFLGRAPISLS